MHHSMVSRAPPTGVANHHTSFGFSGAARQRHPWVSCVAIIRHVGRLNPRDGISKFGVPGREFIESAIAKASNSMRAGVGFTGPCRMVGSIGPLEPAGVSVYRAG